jgi:hypothetical protein
MEKKIRTACSAPGVKVSGVIQVFLNCGMREFLITRLIYLTISSFLLTINWDGYFLLDSYNNNQAFYSPASWGRLEMKTHEPKNRDKTGVKRGVGGDKKPNQKKEKC